MIEQAVRRSPQAANFGLGLALARQGRSTRFSHGSANAGFRCELVAYVESGQGAVVMTNSDSGALLIREILESIANEYGWPALR